jgi:hypothetical protein
MHVAILVRTTVLLDDDIYDRLKAIQEKFAQKEDRRVTFSEVIRLMVRKGLKKK